MNFILNIFIKLTILVLVVALYVSFDGMVNRTMSNTFSLKKLSYFDSIQMVEEEIESENEIEIETLNLTEGIDLILEVLPFIVFNYHFEYLKVRSLFFPGDISPPP